MKKVLMIPGDGIGPEIMAEAKRLLSLICHRFNIKIEFDEVDWGANRYLREGISLPAGAIDKLSIMYDAILFGALGDPRIPDMQHGREILLGLRFGLDLYINLRPVKLLHESLTPLKNISLADLDMVIFRENTEDIYLGLGKNIDLGSIYEIAIDESKHSYNGILRIIEAAFQYAIKHGRQRVTLIDKSNAIKFGGRLWQRVFYEVAKRYPTVTNDHLFVDVAALKMVQQPDIFDVIVTSNLFGDILSDLGAGLIGGLGLAASANINPKGIALFEPVHGSAPDIAGKDKANPFAMFFSVAMMMQYFGKYEAAQAIENAIASCLQKGNVTFDLGGTLSCCQATDEVLSFIAATA